MQTPYKQLTVCSFLLVSWTFAVPSISYANFFPFSSKKTLLPSEYSDIEGKIDIYNKKAIELFEEGRFEEAQELWEKAIQLMEHSEKTYDTTGEVADKLGISEEAQKEFSQEYESDHPSQEGGETEDLYKAAVSAFKEQKYVAAKKLFERIENQIPDYKATRNYLTILKYKIHKASQTLSGDKIKSDQLSREAERGEWKKILEESEEELERKLIEQVAPLYKQALQYYKDRNFKVAKDYFSEIDSILPKYKDTSKYLSRIDVDIRAEEQRVLQEQYKKQALMRKKEQDEWQQILMESEKKLDEKMKEQAHPIYEEALYYYKQRQFEMAKLRFEEVQRIYPGFQSTEKYLGRIGQDIKDEQERRERERVNQFEADMKEKELAYQHEQERVRELKEQEEHNQLKKFEHEVAMRRQEREEWLRVLQESEKERQRKLEAQADFVYQEAVEFYKRREFKDAREAFLEVKNTLPDYKSTEKYLARIEDDITEEQRQELVHQERLLKMKLRKDEVAKQEKLDQEHEFREVEQERRMQEFKERSLARQKEREEWDATLLKNQKVLDKRLKKEADFVFKQALDAYKKQDWERARAGFLEAQEILPGYAKSEKYLARIDKDILKAEEQRRAEIAQKAEQQSQEYVRLREEEEGRRQKKYDEDRKRFLAKQEKRTEKVYTYAVSLYRRGEYALAKDKFEEVERMLPDYKMTRKYLSRVDRDVEGVVEMAQDQKTMELRQQLRQHQVAKLQEEDRLQKLMEDEEHLRRKELKEQAEAREKDREEWEKTVKKIEKEHENRIQGMAEDVYQEAMRYYKAGWYEQAKAALREVDKMAPGYKSTDRYLALTDKKIMKEEKTREESEHVINEQLDRELALRKANMRILDEPVPVTSDRKKLDKAIAKKKKALEKEAEVKYREALDLYEANNFIEAKLKFMEVESFTPDYKATLEYLERIEKKLAGQKQDRETLIDQALTLHEKKTETETAQRIRQRQELSAEQRRKELNAQRRLVDAQYDQHIKNIYDKAIGLYKDKSYVEAQKLFLQIERIQPDYKRTAKYLKKTNRKIEKIMKNQGDGAVAQSSKPKTRSQLIGEALDDFEKRL